MNSNGGTSARPLGWTMVIFLAVLTLLGRIPDLFFHYRNWDEAAVMAEAWAMTKGQVLYRDIVQIHPFLNFALMAPFFRFLSPERVPLAVKTMNLFLVFLGALMIGKITHRWLGSRMLALLGGALFIFYCSRPWATSSFGEFYTPFLVLAALWLLFFANGPMGLTCVAVGILWGLAFFIKQIAFFDAVGICVGYLFLAQTSRTSRIAAIRWMVLGFLSVAALISIYFLIRRALPEAAYSMFVRPLFYAQGEADLGRGGLAIHLARGIFDQLGLSFLAIAGPVLLALSQRDQPGLREQAVLFLWVLLCWLCADLVGLFVTGHFYPHYLLQLVPLASLLPLFILRHMESRVGTAVVMSMLLPLATVLLMDFGWEMWSLKSVGWIPDEVKQSVAAARFIKENTRSGERIFLYKTPNLDIFFLSERLSNNGVYMYHDMIPQHMRDLAQAQRRRELFLSNLPAVIVASPTNYLRVDFIEETLRNNYVRKAALDGGVEIYVRTQ